MSEQFSVAVALRALVMVGCLVAIPMVAIFGHALPELVDQALGSRRPLGSPVASAEADEAPLFVPSTEHVAAVPSAGGHSGLAMPREWSQGQAVESVACDSDGCRVLPATYEASTEPLPGREPALGLSRLSEETGPMVPVLHHPTPTPDRFQRICQRLKELGSTYVLLESWGDGHEHFRFYCKIAIAGNSHYTYRFEATSADPVEAMENVLRQVEGWRAARYGN